MALGTLGALTVLTLQPPPPAVENADDAMTAAAPFLEVQPTSARPDGHRWKVQAGDEHAWIDPSTGDLVEITFAPPH